MSERVVYFLGAGFSAPFGLPVVSNFISLAKDQHLLKRSGGPTFERVFAKLNELARIKNSLSADLSNIEEVLSILEMDAFLGSSESRADFQDFIKSVIAFYTPQLSSYGRGLPGNWEEFVFGKGRLQNGLGLFVAGLYRLVITLNEEDRVPSVSRDMTADFSYDVVTANYDLLLESVVQLINSSMYVSQPLTLRRLPQDPTDAPILAKLHGSIDGGEIVPPTWSKGAHQGIAPRWQLAREALSNANHLRFIGYSLPEADAYVRYLLKFSMLTSSHLKSIDVLCLDPTSQVRARFESFVSLSPFRFANANAAQFFHHLYGQWEGHNARHKVPLWKMLESSHNAAMTGMLI